MCVLRHSRAFFKKYMRGDLLPRPGALRPGVAQGTIEMRFIAPAW
jgi:hypothetical protein